MTLRSGFSSRLQAPTVPLDAKVIHQNESDNFIGTFLPQGGFQSVNASIRSQQQCKLPEPVKAEEADPVSDVPVNDKGEEISLQKQAPTSAKVSKFHRRGRV